MLQYLWHGTREGMYVSDQSERVSLEIVGIFTLKNLFLSIFVLVLHIFSRYERTCMSVHIESENFPPTDMSFLCIDFPAHFRPGHSGMCECCIRFRLWLIDFETLSFNFVLCYPFSSTAKNLIRRSQKLSTRQQQQFVYWHSFLFQPNSCPRCKGPITLGEFE